MQTELILGFEDKESAGNGRGGLRMKKYGFRLLALVMTAAVLCGCSAGKGDGPDSAGDVVPTENSADETPEPENTVSFEAKDMDGNTVTSDVFAESRLTMVNVWATYCNPCLSEMPELGELAGEYDSDDFKIIGIVSDVMEGADQKTLDAAEELIQETGADYPHLLLNESLYYGLLSGVSGVPTTFFIDKEGIVLGIVVGAKDKAVWKEIIDELLEEL